jgi:hypothetical protein
LSRTSSFRALPVVAIGSALCLGIPPITRVLASPDGAEWDAASDPEGCLSCHLGAPELGESESLVIEGLPEQTSAGQSYDLTVILEDPALRNAGFLLTIRAAGQPAGSLAAVDDRVETNGASARSTWEGSFPEQPGRASWQLVWTAPAARGGTAIDLDLWGNAGNDDLSPLGDRPHHRTWHLPAPR